MEEKLLKKTLLGTSESNGTPLTESFPSDKSKQCSVLSEFRGVKMELAKPFGNSIEKTKTEGKTEENNLET